MHNILQHLAHLLDAMRRSPSALARRSPCRAFSSIFLQAPSSARASNIATAAVSITSEFQLQIKAECAATDEHAAISEKGNSQPSLLKFALLPSFHFALGINGPLYPPTKHRFKHDLL